MANKLTVKCPTCHKLVIWQKTSHYRPFCSKRCQLIDLGEWAAEKK
ncbi:MAG: DNA gyrase inhibitor YacG [Arsenophonus sp. NEOnobi-MAG3]